MKGSLKVLAGVLLIISLTVFLAACGGGGGGGNGGGNGEDGTLTGSWSGSWNSSSGIDGGSLSANLTQSGNSITGSASVTGYSPGCGPSFNVSGTVSGNQITFGVFSGGSETGVYTGTFTSTSMSGTYSITGGPCVGDTGTFSMTKVGVSSSSIEITELEGIWTGFEIDGYSEWTATVSGKNMELIGPYEWYSRGAFNINENVSPTQLDYEITESHYSGNIGKISLGIYKIEGYTLTFCFNDPGETARPSSFTPNESFRCWELTK